MPQMHFWMKLNPTSDEVPIRSCGSIVRVVNSVFCGYNLFFMDTAGAGQDLEVDGMSSS